MGLEIIALRACEVLGGQLWFRGIPSRCAGPPNLVRAFVHRFWVYSRRDFNPARHSTTFFLRHVPRPGTIQANSTFSFGFDDARNFAQFGLARSQTVDTLGSVGACSRRSCLACISAGRYTLGWAFGSNNQRARLADKADQFEQEIALTHEEARIIKRTHAWRGFCRTSRPKAIRSNSR